MIGALNCIHPYLVSEKLKPCIPFDYFFCGLVFFVEIIIVIKKTSYVTGC